MALNSKLAVARRNAALDNILANLNSGTLLVYGNTQATDADTATSGQTLLATLTFGSTAFAASSSGTATANTITSGTAVATGTATWFRALKSDASTVVMDGSAGTSGTNLVLNSTAIQSGATVSVSSFSITFPA